MDDTPDSRTSPTLLGRLRNGADAQAWEKFVDRYTPRIYSWCRKHELQDADACDVTQVVLFKLVNRMRTFDYDPKGSFRAWLDTVTRNAWCDFLKQRSRSEHGSGDPQVQEWLESVQAGDDLAKELDPEFERELGDEALARVQVQVEPNTWQAFYLSAFQRHTGKEIAKQLGMTEDAVYQAKHRVQVKLRKELARLRNSAAEEGL